MKIYVLNNKFYVQEGNRYQQMTLLILDDLSFNSTGIYVDSVEGAEEYTYQELKDKLLGDDIIWENI